jgi:hypothetical protein
LIYALLLNVGFCKQVADQNMTKDSQKQNDAGSYAWGPECADGLQIGLLLEGRVFRPDTSIPWRWAIRNNRDSMREVTVRHDSDPAFRYRLAVRRPDADNPLWEFPPPMEEERSTFIRGTQVVVMPESTTELEGDTASIDQSWGPGTYNLQLMFGGKDFKFSCESGIVQIEVR